MPITPVSLLLLMLPQGPVWRQLKTVCYKSPTCAQACAQQWGEEFEAQVLENERLQKQLVDRDAEVKRLQQALAELRGVS